MSTALSRRFLKEPRSLRLVLTWDRDRVFAGKAAQTKAFAAALAGEGFQKAVNRNKGKRVRA
jgi:hypothetical protein